MKLVRYKFRGTNPEDWDFDNIYFNRVNLFVGDSGTGKTRCLNTIINYISQIISDKIMFPGNWDTDFEIENILYNYKLIVKDVNDNNNQKYIEFEELKDVTHDKMLIKRDGDKFYWKNQNLPKLSKSISSIYLLKDEEIINNIYKNLKKIVARRFSGDELIQNFRITEIQKGYIKKITKNKKYEYQSLLNEPIDFHNKISILKKIDSAAYSRVVSLFKDAFPFINETKILSFSEAFPNLILPIQAPVFCIKERNIKTWIPVNDISSGMQKLFLLILDLILLQDNGILLIDEYENSLGINAINFLPEMIYSISEKCQFILTSHHPYIINTIPIENWLVFHRNGMNIKIKNGNELKDKYKKSKQEQFVQLINDPFYSGGVE